MNYCEDENISKEKIKLKKIYKNDKELNIKINVNQTLYLKRLDANNKIKQIILMTLLNLNK